MTKPLRTCFIIADGGRARWVMRDAQTHAFHTVREMASHEKAAHAYSGGTVESVTGHRHSGREPHEPARLQAQAFAAMVAEAIGDGAERLVVVAPARVLNAIEAALPAKASARLAGRLAKDLTKVADHDLARWLTPLEL